MLKAYSWPRAPAAGPRADIISLNFLNVVYFPQLGAFARVSTKPSTPPWCSGLCIPYLLGKRFDRHHARKSASSPCTACRIDGTKMSRRQFPGQQPCRRWRKRSPCQRGGARFPSTLPDWPCRAQQRTLREHRTCACSRETRRCCCPRRQRHLRHGGRRGSLASLHRSICPQ